MLFRCPKLIGATKLLESEPGTIRGDLTINVGCNMFHSSDIFETAEFEIALWFTSSELCGWQPSDQLWRIES